MENVAAKTQAKHADIKDMSFDKATFMPLVLNEAESEGKA